MALVKSKALLNEAMKKGYAVGHFNVENMEVVQAVIRAAEESNSPVMLAVSESAINYAGLDFIVSIIKLAAKKTKVPVVLHLDHGKDLKTIKRCIDSGFTSIMIDASQYPFEKNVRIVKKVVQMAKKKNIPVEAELGSMNFENGKDRQSNLTDPCEAEKFVRLTGIDSLAISIGTSHGAYKFKDKPKLDFKLLKLIDDVVDIPLVLHGASEIPQDYIKKGIRHGARWKGARGLDNKSLKQACSQGINKVNIHTDINIIRIASEREYFKLHPEVTDPRKINNYTNEQIVRFVKSKLDLLGSTGKA